MPQVYFSIIPYRKPNDKTVYINQSSNHPKNILKTLPSMINDRISSISANKELFDIHKAHYEKKLLESGFNEKLEYKPYEGNLMNRQRKRKVIWFNPPFNMNLKTNLGKHFLNLICKHFPRHHKFNKIFNKNTIKISYSCMDNMANIINKHNKKILRKTEAPTRECNCRVRANCPLKGYCLVDNVIYKANIRCNNETKFYIGSTEGSFKIRYNTHTLSFRNSKYKNSTELSKHIWQLKDNNIDYNIDWEILTKSKSTANCSSRCNLCLNEKFEILKANKLTCLNKRNEIISTCRHINKFLVGKIT